MKPASEHNEYLEKYLGIENDRARVLYMLDINHYGKDEKMIQEVIDEEMGGKCDFSSETDLITFFDAFSMNDPIAGICVAGLRIEEYMADGKDAIAEFYVLKCNNRFSLYSWMNIDDDLTKLGEYDSYVLLREELKN